MKRIFLSCIVFTVIFTMLSCSQGMSSGNDSSVNSRNIFSSPQTILKALDVDLKVNALARNTTSTSTSTDSSSAHDTVTTNEIGFDNHDSEDKLYFAILRNEVSKDGNIEFGIPFKLDAITEFSLETIADILGKKLSELSEEEIRNAQDSLKNGFLKLGFVQVDKTDDSHALIWFFLFMNGSPRYVYIECTENIPGYLDLNTYVFTPEKSGNLKKAVFYVEKRYSTLNKSSRYFHRKEFDELTEKYFVNTDYFIDGSKVIYSCMDSTDISSPINDIAYVDSSGFAALSSDYREEYEFLDKNMQVICWLYMKENEKYYMIPDIFLSSPGGQIVSYAGNEVNCANATYSDESLADFPDTFIEKQRVMDLKVKLNEIAAVPPSYLSDTIPDEDRIKGLVLEWVEQTGKAYP